MKDGNNTIRFKTVKANRKIISVSFPLDLADRMQWLVDRYGFNRSDFISKAVKFYLDSLGIKKVGE